MICTKWAIPGMLSPCWLDVGDIKAPVAKNKMFLRDPCRMAGKIVLHSTPAEQPHPEPPACTSCLSRSNNKSPQS